MKNLSKGAISKGGSAKIEAWWDSSRSEKHCAESAWQLANRIYKQQETARAVNVRNLQLFVGTQMLGIFSPDILMTGSVLSSGELAFNIVRAVVLTASAIVARHKPRVQILTQGGSHKMRRRGKALTKYIDGIFYLTKTYEKTRQAFQDALVTHNGVIKVSRDGNRIVHDRVFVDEIGVDNYDALYGEPQVMFHQRLVPRDMVLARLESGDTDRRNMVMKAPQANKEKGENSTSDVILLREGWHVASKPDGDDGAHILFLEDGALTFERYSRNYHPLVPIRYSYRPRGWIGKSAVDDIVGMQYFMNEVLEDMQEGLLKNKPRIGIESGSQINVEEINDVPFSFVEFSKTPPIPLVWPSTVPELMLFAETIKRWAFELHGLSQTTGLGRKQPGIESAQALMQFEEIQNERTRLVEEDFQNAHVEIALRDVDLAREIAADNGGKFPINVPMGKGRYQRINWSEVDMERDAYMMQAFPTSFLPHTPSGRLQTLETMMSLGLLGRDEAMMLLDYPDLESVTTLIRATIEHVDMQIENMLDENKSQQPSPFHDPVLAGRRVTQALLKAEADGYPDKNLELLRRYVTEVQKMEAKVVARQQLQVQAAMLEQQTQQAGAPTGQIPAGGIPT